MILGSRLSGKRSRWSGVGERIQSWWGERGRRGQGNQGLAALCVGRWEQEHRLAQSQMQIFLLCCKKFA